MKDFYNSGEYSDNNRDWHEGDARWKFEKIFNLLLRNKITPRSICDIGCGTGGILKEFHKKDKKLDLLGLDISKEAISIAKKRQDKNLSFDLGELPHKKYDLILAIDLVEHLEDYFTFLRIIRKSANHKLFHIPLSISVRGLLAKDYYANDKNLVGHLHPFTKDLFLGILKDEGYEVLDWVYTAPGIERIGKKLISRLAKLFRIIIFSLNKEFCVKLFGGFSLLVLTK